MPERYWLELPNGGRQKIDPSQFDLDLLAEQALRVGGRIVIESAALPAPPPGFEPPITALAPMFRQRLVRLYECRVDYSVDMNTRPTSRILGGYYRRRRLVRVYTHDRGTGRRPLEELFDTFLHEIAHHIEYTEPESFGAVDCARVPGRMHSRLFWRILGELKRNWATLHRG